MPTDAKRKVINVNIILYGPSQAGKTSNIQFIHRIIHRKLKPNQRGRISTLCQDGYPDVSYEFLPIELGELKGIETNLYIYSAPAHEDGLETRLNLLNEAAGVVFIADSHPERVEDNMESLANLKEELQWWDLEYDAFPVVIQYNKRDLPQVATIDELESQLNPEGKPYFEAVAAAGQGVRDTFALISKMAVRRARLQLIAREKAARQKEAAQKVRSDVEAAQFEHGKDQEAPVPSGGKAPDEITLDTEPPPRADTVSETDSDDSEELVHEAEREEAGTEGASQRERPTEAEGVANPSEPPSPEPGDIAQQVSGGDTPPPSAQEPEPNKGKGRKRRGKKKRGRRKSGVAAAQEAATEPLEDSSDESPALDEADVSAPESVDDAVVAVQPDSTAEAAHDTTPEPDSGETPPPASAEKQDESPSSDLPETTKESVPKPTDSSIDMDEPGEPIPPPDDFLKTAFSFDDPETPFIVDSMDVGDAVFAAESDDVGVIAVGAEEDEFYDEDQDEEDEEQAQPIALHDAPSLASIPFVPDMSGEPEVKIQTYADDDEEDEGPLFRLGARAMEEEELQLDEEMLLDDSEEELDLLEDEGDLEEPSEQGSEVAAETGPEATETGTETSELLEPVADDSQEPQPPDAVSAASLSPVEDLDVIGNEPPQQEPDLAAEPLDKDLGVIEEDAEPSESPTEEPVADETPLESDQGPMLEDHGPEASPSESTLDLPEEAVNQEGTSALHDSAEQEGPPPSSDSTAELEEQTTPSVSKLEESPADSTAELEHVENDSQLEAEPPAAPDEAEPGAVDETEAQARLVPEEDVIFESIVEEPVEEYVSPEVDEEAPAEEPAAAPDQDEVEPASRAEVVSWGEADRVDAATLRLPVVVRLPGKDEEVMLAVTIHVDELTDAL